MRPSVGRTKPVITLNAVVLPAPLGPIRLTTSCSRTEKVISEIASNPPKRTAICSRESTVSGGVSFVSMGSTSPRLGRFRQRYGDTRPAHAASPPLMNRGHDAVGQEEDDGDHQAAIDDPLDFRSGGVAQKLGNDPEDQAADDRSGQRPLAAGDHHDHHGHRVDEEENVGIDDPDVMGVETACSTRHRRRDDGRKHEIARDVDADRGRERLVLLERDHGAPETRAHQPAYDDIGDDPDSEHDVVVRHLPVELRLPDARDVDGEGRNIVERHWPLGERHPVEGDEPHDLGEADRHNDEISAPNLERDPSDDPPGETGKNDAENEAQPGRMGIDGEREIIGELELEAERDQGTRIGTDAEEAHLAEIELTRIAEEQIEAHRRDDEDPGDDEDMQIIEIRHPERNGDEEGYPQPAEPAPHPMRSARANSPVGLIISTTMIRRKPMASRYPDEM